MYSSHPVAASTDFIRSWKTAYLFHATAGLCERHLSRSSAKLPILLLAIAFAGSSWILCPDRAVAQSTEAADAIDKDDLAKIKAADSADQLMDLGKSFARERKTPAAYRCVERACELDPKLLTDDKKQSPSSWNEIWFGHRSTLREAKLADDNAQGRLELAKWLFEAEIIKPARRLTAAALNIDDTLTEARELARQLQPLIGLDFRYALKHPVLLDEYQDDGVPVEPSTGKKLLLAPIYYLVPDRRYMLTPTSAKIYTEDDKRCRVRGIILSRDSSSSRSEADKPADAPVEMLDPPTNPPEQFESTFYERLQFEIKDDVPTVIWQNTIRSRPPAGSDDRSRSGRSRSGSGSDSDDKRGETPANGWAGIVVEYPEEAETLTFEILDGDLETVNLRLLRLTQPQSKTDDTDNQEKPADRIQQVAEYTSDTSPIMAQLATEWLSQVGGMKDLDPEDTTVRSLTETALINALTHADKGVRQTAARALADSNEPLSPETREHISRKLKPQAAAMVLNAMRSLLETYPLDASEEITRGRSSKADDLDTRLNLAVEALPVSSAPENAFAILTALLQSSHEKISRETLGVLLKYGSQRSVRALASLPSNGEAMLLPAIKQITDDEVKAAVLRILMTKSDVSGLSKVLEACGGLAISITSPQDPLLLALEGDLQPEVLQRLLELLSRSDLSVVAESGHLVSQLEELSVKNKDNPAVRSALLALTLAQFDRPYEAPIRRPTTSRKNRSAPPGFQAILAKLAVDSTVDTDTAIKAVETLVASGQLEGICEEFNQSSNPERCRTIVQAISNNEALRERESLPVFLAFCLSHNDARTVQIALAALATIDKSTKPEDHWRLRLAIKQGVDDEQLTTLSGHADDRVAEQALGLLKRLVRLTPEQVQELTVSAGAPRRLAFLKATLEDFAKEPVGEYGCMVYADIQTDDPDSSRSRRHKDKLNIRRGVPLVSAKVVIEKHGGDLDIMSDGQSILIPDKKQRGSRRSFAINAAPLIAAALKSPSAEKEGLAGKVDLVPYLDDKPMQCDLSLAELGSWRGDLENISTSRGSKDSKPVRIINAWILLEPLRPE